MIAELAGDAAELVFDFPEYGDQVRGEMLSTAFEDDANRLLVAEGRFVDALADQS